MTWIPMGQLPAKWNEWLNPNKHTHKKKLTVFCHVLPTPFLNAGSLNLAFRRATGAVVPQLIGQLQQRTS
jgi:hypothetical protein